MRRVPPALAALAAGVSFALACVAPAAASVTLWPTCSSPPGGDYARCAKGAFPQSVAAGPDGAVWFTTARANLGRVTTSGGVSQFEVPVSGLSRGLMGGLALGSDGALWFPQLDRNGLWRGTVASPSIFSYEVGGPTDTQPRDVALGADGALWVAEAKSDSVGHLSPTGSYTHYTLPPKAPGTFVSSFAIAAGPDGRMWIARPRSIVAITTSGVVTSYPVPGNDPDSIALGPDGAIWFAMYGTDRVGRLTTTGALTLFDLPKDAAPSSITAGPDGALWIGLGKNKGIMRMTTSGSWSVTPLLFSSQVSSITTGSDGAIWFGDLSGSRIGRIDGLPVVGAPAVGSISPSFGAGGTKVRVSGSGLSEASAVTVGGAAARFSHSKGRLEVTVPPGAGPAPIRVRVGNRLSPPTDAATFTYAARTATAPATPPRPPVAPTVELSAAKLAPGGTLSVSVRSTTAAPFEIAAALQLTGDRAHIAGAAKLQITGAGRARGRFAGSGTRSVRLKLSAQALRRIKSAARRGARLEVGVRLALGGGQTAVGQRSYRLRTR